MKQFVIWLFVFVFSFVAGTSVTLLVTNVVTIEHDSPSSLLRNNQVDNKAKCRLCEIYVKEIADDINHGCGNLSLPVKDSNHKRITDPNCRKIEWWPHNHDSIK